MTETTTAPTPPISKPVVLHECCAACHYWKNNSCRRYPPTHSLANTNCRVWANTLGTDWCGEFKRAVRVPKAAEKGLGPLLEGVTSAPGGV